MRIVVWARRWMELLDVNEPSFKVLISVILSVAHSEFLADNINKKAFPCLSLQHD